VINCGQTKPGREGWKGAGSQKAPPTTTARSKATVGHEQEERCGSDVSMVAGRYNKRSLVCARASAIVGCGSDNYDMYAVPSGYVRGGLTTISRGSTAARMRVGPLGHAPLRDSSARGKERDCPVRLSPFCRRRELKLQSPTNKGFIHRGARWMQVLVRVVATHRQYGGLFG
jgi:hypothetical protein